MEKVEEKKPWADQAMPRKGKLVRVSAHKDGFWCAGAQHTVKGVDHPHDRFNQEQLWRLHTSPFISVSYVDAPEADKKA